MQFPKYHHNCTENAIMISGIFRSGTTMLGKIIGSFKNMEYCFEPPLLFHLNCLIKNKRMDESLAAEILRTYFAEDIMLNYHHGKEYNMRPLDDSCIFNMKSYTEVMGRWQNIRNSEDAIELMKSLESRLVFKSPAVYAIIPGLLNLYPGLKIIETRRDLKSVFSSIMAKKWFSTSIIENKNYFSNWPYHNNNLHVPYYIDSEDINFWTEANEVTKTVHVLNTLTKTSLEFRKLIKKTHPKQYREVKYENVLNDPTCQIEELSEFLDAEWTPITNERVDEIKSTKRKYNVDDLLAKCDEKIKNDFLNYNELLGY